MVMPNAIMLNVICDECRNYANYAERRDVYIKTFFFILMNLACIGHGNFIVNSRAKAFTLQVGGLPYPTKIATN
jgi:hypothetical protein